MKTVFLVQHVHEFGDEREDVKIIGIYSSRQLAEQAVDRLKEAPGFGDSRQGFSIDEYQLNADHWAEGFATVGTS